MNFSFICSRIVPGLLKRAVVLTSSFVSSMGKAKQRVVHRSGLIALAFTLSACGGGGSDLQSGSLVVSTLILDSLVFENGQIEGVYQSTNLGPYDIVLDDGETSLDITATLDASTEEGASISIFSADDDFFPSFCRELGDDEATSVSDGQAFTQQIDEGSNAFVIRLANSDFSQCVDYRFLVFREFETPTIEALLTSSTAEFTGDNDVFDPDDTEYDLTVSYQNCSFALGAQTNSPNAEITVDGIKAANRQSRFVALEPGVERDIPIVVTLPSGAQTTYNFAVTRAEAEDDDLEVDSTIANISLSGGRFLSDFNCLDNTQDIQVNSDVDTIDLTVETSVDGASATYFIGDEFDDDSEFTDVADDGVITVPLDLGDNILTLIITATDDETASLYQFTVERTEAEWIYVSSTEELQNALRNALPNQEIVITNGDYIGVTGLDASGSDSAHFFSEQSGTADEPITLRALENGTVTLFGDDLGVNSVLTLSGDYWQVYDLELESAQTGLILEGANNNVVHNVDVTDVGQRGIHIRNDSSDNVLSQLSVTDTGLALDDTSTEVLAEALVIGSDDSDWLSAPTPGTFVETDSNNRVFDFDFGPGIPSELIDIKEGTVGTEIAFGNLDGINVSNPESSAMLVIKGNDVSVHHNTFEYTLNDSVDQIIATTDASEDFHLEEWGENAEIFENVFDITADESLVLVSAGAANTGVDGNIRSDDIEPIYDGDSINDGFSQPAYQLQLVEDNSLCISPGIITLVIGDGEEEVSGDVVQGVLEECDSTDTLQQWQIEINDGGNIVFRNQEDESRFAPTSLTAELESLITFYGIFDSFLDEGSIFRWVPSFITEDIQLVSSLDIVGAGLTATSPSELSTSSVFEDQDQNILSLITLDTRFDGNNENQRFKLIRIQ